MKVKPPYSFGTKVKQRHPLFIKGWEIFVDIDELH